MTVPTVPTKATIPETGRARYLRYLLQRCVERPQLLADGARAELRRPTSPTST